MAAYVSQCHGCQVQHLKMEHVADVRAPRMSGPGEHVHDDLAGPFATRAVRVEGGPAGRGRRRLSTEQTGTAYVCLVVDYFTKAAELVVNSDKRVDTVAPAFHDRWLCRYGVPEWVTSDNGREFAGAFAHQLERFGIEHVHSSAYHAQANGAVERLVRTFKAVLAAKTAGVHGWEALMPQIQAEYMQRKHTSTGYSPNELIFARPIKLPMPMGDLASGADNMAAAAQMPSPLRLTSINRSRSQHVRRLLRKPATASCRRSSAMCNSSKRGCCLRGGGSR